MATARPLVIAHRGGTGPWPENTVGAFLHGLALGADGVELDVHLSADGVAVIHHDETLGRVFAGRRRICDCTLAELRTAPPVRVPGAPPAVDAPAAALSRIPTLDEALRAIAEYGPACVNVELKTDTLAYPDIEAQVADTITRYHDLSFIVSSFNPASLARFHAICPDMPTAFLDHRPSPDTAATAVRVGAAGIHPNHRGLTRAVMAAACTANLAVRPYTVNDPAALRRLTAWGVDALITDDVAAVQG